MSKIGSHYLDVILSEKTKQKKHIKNKNLETNRSLKITVIFVARDDE